MVRKTLMITTVLILALGTALAQPPIPTDGSGSEGATDPETGDPSTVTDHNPPNSSENRTDDQDQSSTGLLEFLASILPF